MSSLSEKLALLTTTPIFKDVEDDDDPTFAKLTEKRDDHDEFVDVAKTGSSKLRRQTADLLASDTRYAGKKVSRNKLHDEDDYADEDDMGDDLDSDAGSSADDDSEDADSGNSDEPEDDFTDDKVKQTSPRIKPGKDVTFGEDFSRYADDDDEEDSSFEDSQGEDSEEEEEEDVVESSEEEENAVQSFSKSNLDEEVAKGEAAKTQLGVWDRLLEQRIKLQGMLGVVSQMPRPEMWDEFLLESGEEYQESLRAGQRSLCRLMDDLLELQTLLLHQNPDTKYVVSETHTKKSDADEVTSDEDASMVKEPANDLPKIQRKKKKVPTATLR